MPIRKKKCEKLKQEFIDLYVGTKIKEKAIPEETKTKATQSFYRIRIPDKSSRNIFTGLVLASYRIPYEISKNYEIY